jgi:hypothetical protein
MRVFKVQLEGYNGPTIYKADEILGVLREIEDLLKEDDVEQKITITQDEISEEEFNKIGEFSGY